MLYGSGDYPSAIPGDVDIVGEAVILLATKISEHCVSFTGPSLPVGEDGDVVSFDYFIDLLAEVLVDVFLGGGVIEGAVEFDLEVVVVIVSDSNCAILGVGGGTSASTSTTWSVFFSRGRGGLTRT